MALRTLLTVEMPGASLGGKKIVTEAWSQCHASILLRHNHAPSYPHLQQVIATGSRQFSSVPSNQNNDSKKGSNLRSSSCISPEKGEEDQNPMPTTTKKYTVTWVTSQNDNKKSLTFDVYDGETLRTAALRRNIVSPHNGRANLINCRGLGTCGTCAIEILSGNVDPPQRNTAENLRLIFPPHNAANNHKKRLACQIQIRGDIQVQKRTGFWGQDASTTKVAEPSAPQKYLGDLEYLWDNKSPPEETKS